MWQGGRQRTSERMAGPGLLRLKGGGSVVAVAALSDAAASSSESTRLPEPPTKYMQPLIYPTKEHRCD